RVSVELLHSAAAADLDAILRSDVEATRSFGDVLPDRVAKQWAFRHWSRAGEPGTEVISAAEQEIRRDDTISFGRHDRLVADPDGADPIALPIRDGAVAVAIGARGIIGIKRVLQPSADLKRPVCSGRADANDLGKMCAIHFHQLYPVVEWHHRLNVDQPQ